MTETLSSPPSAPGWSNGFGRFLIDGFPRKMDQALKFDESVCKSSFVLFFSTSEEILLQRLLERGKTSGREDDNKESIVKRFRTFQRLLLLVRGHADVKFQGTFLETSMPVVDYYRERNKVVEIDSSPSIDEVYAVVKREMDARLPKKGPANE